MPHKRAVIFANGSLPDPDAAKRLLQNDDEWIAADGGSRHALALGRAPDVLIGDLDSLPNPVRDSLIHAGTKIQSFSAEKDETDLELALAYAVREGYPVILILAGLGGRTDQILANLSLLTDPALESIDVRIDDGCEEVFRIGKESAVRGTAGDIVSLLPIGVPAEGVTTDGLKFPLRGETLIPHRTRGVSNRMLEARATITVERGVLLCIHTRTAA
ncbi:MAG: thiamine diphosphokinase [Anaerolineales bacterium]|nr:thiamine diphosphokinase [Anaerolineales bacterium]